MIPVSKILWSLVVSSEELAALNKKLKSERLAKVVELIEYVPSEHYENEDEDEYEGEYGDEEDGENEDENEDVHENEVDNNNEEENEDDYKNEVDDDDDEDDEDEDEDEDENGVDNEDYDDDESEDYDDDEISHNHDHDSDSGCECCDMEYEEQQYEEQEYEEQEYEEQEYEEQEFFDFLAKWREANDAAKLNLHIVSTSVRKYSRILLVSLLLNKRNSDSNWTKWKFSHSIALLFSASPTIDLVLSRLPINLNRKFVTNKFLATLLTVVFSMAQYPTDPKYQRSYLSMYLSLVAADLMFREYTRFHHYWLFFPFSFAKTWQYYVQDSANCPKLFTRYLDYFLKDFNLLDIRGYLFKKLKLFYFVLPLFGLVNYSKTRNWKNVKTPVIQSVKLFSVTLLMALAAQLSTLSLGIKTSTRLNLIGFVSTLPTLFYSNADRLWITLVRQQLISSNIKHNSVLGSRLNTFRVDKLLIIASLMVIFKFEEEGKLKNKFIRLLIKKINGDV